MPALSPTTQRAYTFTLAKANDTDALLLETHRSTNAGAAAALHWMLTLIGGLSAERGFTTAARIVLTRCWFSVESREGAPAAFVVPHDLQENGSVRWRTVDALDAMLAVDGLSADTRASWIAEVAPSIEAALRPDAVWVNRRAAFNALAHRSGAIDQADIDDFIFDSGLYERDRFFAIDVEPKAPDAMKAVGAWLSRRAGTGAGSDFASFARVYDEIATALSTRVATRTPAALAETLAGVATIRGDASAISANIVAQLSGPGHKSRTKNFLVRALAAEAIDEKSYAALLEAAKLDAATCANKPAKGSRSYAQTILADIAAACGYTYAGKPARHAQYCTMFDLAARRFTGVLSFIRNAERDRAEFQVDALQAAVPAAVLAWGDAYSQIEGPIRPRSLGWWTDVREIWKTTCVDATDRVTALADLQKERNRDRWSSGRNAEKMGNLQLFATIAVEPEAAAVRDTAGALHAYVAYSEARAAVADRKAPMLRHIDALLSPVWVEFGTSRWPIALEPTATGARVTLGLVGPTGFTKATLVASGKRFARDIGDHLASVGPAVSRGDRLSRLAGQAGTGSVSLAIEPTWNGSLRFDRDRIEGGAPHRWTLSFSAALQKRTAPDRLVTYMREIREANTKRGTSARLNFGRLPGLRVLGVNTGLRSGAACAVLETIGTDTLLSAARAANIPPPAADALYFKIQTTSDGKRETVFYRRIAADVLPDGTQHPCPWARESGRRFIVALPGESHDDIRKASPDEVALVQEIGRMLRVPVRLPRNVAHLQMSALNAVRRALAGHGRIARAAYILSQFAFGTGDVTADRALANIERLQKNVDPDVAAILERYRFGVDNLQPAALQPLVAQLTALWTNRDPLLQAALGRVRRWLFPNADSCTQHVGDLSLDRIANLSALRSAHVAWAMRPHPLTFRASDSLGSEYGRKCLDARAALRQERQRVLASRIVEAALGGSRSSPRDRRGTEPVDAPCDLIVVEDLRGFRTTQTRSRRENATLMTWAHAGLYVHLEQVCELHGLPLRTVVAAYTSQESGSTGESGIRVRQVPVATLLEAPWWRDAIESALRHRARKTITEQERLLLTWSSRWNPSAKTWIDADGRTWTRGIDRWTSCHNGQKSPPPVLLPDVEGPLFLAVGMRAPVSADTNAAATIATRVLLDPDWPGTWSHVATQGGIPIADKVRGSACFRGVKRLRAEVQPLQTSSDDEPTHGTISNVWRRRSAQPIDATEWIRTAEYFASVRDEIAQSLRLAVERSTDEAQQPTA